MGQHKGDRVNDTKDNQNGQDVGRHPVDEGFHSINSCEKNVSCPLFGIGASKVLGSIPRLRGKMRLLREGPDYGSFRREHGNIRSSLV